MNMLLSVLGIIVSVGIAFLMSKNKKEINWKGIGIGLGTQIVLTFLMIKTPLWKVIEVFSKGVLWVIGQSNAGINFVFGGLTGNFVFWINSLLPIVFISALVGLAFHFGILQKFVKIFGKLIARVFKVDSIVAVNLVSNMFLGQSESLFMTKSYLPKAKDSVIFATLVGGMGSISVSTMGLYVSMGASIEWIIISLPVILFSSLTLLQIIEPTRYSDEEIEIEDDKGANFIDTMMNYAQSGFKSVVGITVALLVFLSVVALINSLLGFINPSLSLENIVGLIFYPFGLLMGVPMGEIKEVAQLLGTKLVTNEAVAMGTSQFGALSTNTKALMTTVLCSFAGIGSVGIMIGSYTAIAPNKTSYVAKVGVKALLVATLSSILTGCIIGLIL